jgi:hypothetical protein
VPTLRVLGPSLILLLGVGGPAAGALAAAGPQPPPPPAETPAPPAETPASPSESAPPPAEAPPSTAEAQAPAEKAPNPCTPQPLAGGRWIDRLQRGMAHTVCQSALWFDHLFGGEVYYQEQDASHGWLRGGVVWDEQKGVDPLFRFRASLSLPRMENRLKAIVGRGEHDELIAEEGGTLEPSQALIDTIESDDEWLLGLGYSPARGVGNRFDLGAGVRLATPLDPYVKGSYRHYTFFSDRSLGRLRQTVFWERSEGYGTTSRADLERVLDPEMLVRWRTTGTISESTEGVRWETGVSLFQRIGRKHAVAYQVQVRGETDADVPVREYGVHFIYRQSVAREWLFIDLRPALVWRREELADQREPVAILGAGLEIQFGR